MANKPSDFLVDFNDPILLDAIEQWDLYDFLEEHKVDWSPSGNNIGRDFIGVIPCPNCNDHNYHFGIHKTQKFGTCWICKHYQHPINIISFFAGIPFLKAHERLIDSAEFNPDIEHRVKHILNSTPRSDPKAIYKKDPLPKSIKLIPSIIDKIPTVRSFFKKRKLTYYHAEKFHIQLVTDPKYRSYVMWPLIIADHPISYQMRHLLIKRYHNGEHLNRYLFNEDNIIPDKPVFLVEGFLDMTNVDAFIDEYYPNEASVITGGLKSLSREQLWRLQRFRLNQLYVMFDGDSWFDYYRIRNQLPYNVNYLILPRKEDPNSLSFDQLLTITKEVFE